MFTVKCSIIGKSPKIVRTVPMIWFFSLQMLAQSVATGGIEIE